jgi:hypothetical protein
MPLINLQTNLKSLKYGRDRFNGGDSGQPYIQTNIPDEISPYIGTTDFLLRGGLRAVQDSVVDVERLGKMFDSTKSPNGILFTAKQQLLSRTAVRTQTSGILNEGVYTPLSTLAQAGVVAFGGHLNKQGINPFADTGANATGEFLYYNRVKPNPNSVVTSIATNRLVSLWDSLNTNSTKGNFGGKGTTLNPGGNTSDILISYTGGPGSALGIGSTNIKYAQGSRTPISTSPSKVIFSNFGLQNLAYSSNLLLNPYYQEPAPQTATGGQLLNSGFIPDPSNPGNLINVGTFSTLTISPKQGARYDQRQVYTSPKIQDFRKVIRKQLKGEDYKKSVQSGATPNTPSYNSNAILDLRTNQGQPGQRSGKSYANYDQGVLDLTNESIYGGINLNNNLGTFYPGLDIINSVPVYRSENASTDSHLNDLVSFRIAIIDNDAPSFKTFIHFRAFIDSMSDSYSADWTPFKYLGRGENFYNYQGFSRQISLSWTVAAQSKQELIPMYQKLNYLASSLTPDYSPSGYMRGNLAQLTVGGYLYEQPGIITSLTYDVPEESPWEIAIDVLGEDNGDGAVKQLPHIIRVTGFNFIPIQRFRPGIQNNTYSSKNNTDSTLDDIGVINTYGPEQYIALANSKGNNYADFDTNKTFNVIG